jgi:hypothetical protein
MASIQCFLSQNIFSTCSVWPLKGPFFGRWRIKRTNLFLLGLLGQKYSLDVWQDSSLSNGDSGKKFVQLLVVSDGELQMTGDDSCLLVVTGGVTCQLQDFSSQVLHDCSEVDWSSSTNSLSVVSLSEKTVDSSYWELKSSTGGSGLRLSLNLSSLSSS